MLVEEAMLEQWTYRRDRWGEGWHIVPAGELGSRGRALCGAPRQGTPLSEGYADSEPRRPERLCQACAEQAATRGIPVQRA